MKKIIHLSVIAVLAIIIASCSKSSSGYSGAVSNLQNTMVAQPVKVRVISDWLSLPLSQVYVNGLSQLTGQYTFTQVMSYETGMHKRLAYVKIPARYGYIYKALPAIQATVDGNHALNFSIDFSAFQVTINNKDFPTSPINAPSFSNFQYRYIIIPTEVYLSFSIDWNDLPAVAAALNFQL